MSMEADVLRIPGTEFHVRRVGLGAMPLSLAGRPDADQAHAVIRRAVELGITLVDTADVYALDDDDIGHNERLVAGVLKEMGAGFGGTPGDPQVVVATKGGMRRPGGRWVPDGRPEHLRAAAEATLRRLGVERLDLHQFHTPDPKVPFLESVGALADLRDRGLIAALGLSNVSPDQLEAARAVVPIASVQNRLSPWDLGSGPVPMVERCRKLGVLFLPYAPLGGSGKVAQVLSHPPLRQVAEGVGSTPARLILAWHLHRHPHVVPIPGASRIRSVESSAGAGAVRLEPAQLQALERAFRSLPGAPGLVRRWVRKLRGRIR